MHAYSLRHLTEDELDCGLDGLVTRRARTDAALVAHIAEKDRRKTYAPAYDSMHAYCVGRLHLSEHAAYRRIQAARAALEFPALFFALADGRLHLSAVCVIAPHLTQENARELVAAATHKTYAFIRDWLAQRFAPPAAATPRQLEVRLPRLAASQARRAAVVAPEPLPLEALPPSASRMSYEMQYSMTPEDHETFRYAQALLSHAVPSGDVAEIHRRAMALLVKDSEKRRFGSSQRSNAKRGPVQGRKVPAATRRVVWTRDQGRCTFVAPTGHRCGSREFLEFDHVVPVARGGLSDEGNLRLRCRGHNQAEAKRVFGANFVQARRREAFARTARRAAPAGTPGPPP